jgi:peptide/nickel transport system substrate-binding protein
VRWQVLIASLGLVLLVGLLGYSAYSFTTEVVPTTGGTYVEGLAGSPQAINPLLCQLNDADRDLCRLIFEGLTALDEKGNVIPRLAERWEISPDGLKYTFYLRKDVLWHDGAPFNADDVLYTINALKDPAFPGLPDLANLWRTVTVEKIDAHTVTFTLVEPFAPFLDYTTLGLLPAHLWAKVPAALLEKSQLNAQPIGTGPFRVVEVSAERVRLQPNPYWRGRAPYLTGLEFRFFPDHRSLLPAFEEGLIDGLGHIALDDVATAASLDDLTLYSAPLAGYTMVLLNLNSPNAPFFQDKAVRQALLYALDRQRLIDTVLAGQGLVAHSPILPGTWAYDEQVSQYPFDLKTANALLDAAGWQDSDGDGIRDRGGRALEFVLLSNDLPPNPNEAEFIAQAWAKIGVRAVPQPVTFAGLVSDFLVPRNYDAMILHWELPGDPDPYPLWHSTQINSGQNYAGWNNRRADELIEQARGLNDREQRRELYVQFQQIFAEEVPALLLYYPVYTYGIRDKVKAVQIGPLNEPGDRFRTIADWYIVTKRITTRQRVPRAN